jgi:DNA uptake protein ComE-like DNA-binding protein
MKHGILRLAVITLVVTGGFCQAQDPDAEVKPPARISKETQARAKARAAKLEAKRKTKASRDAKQVDVNTASRDTLKAIPGLPEAYVDKIIAGRPYLTKAHLVTNQVLPEGIFLAIRDRIAVHAPPKP